MCAARGNSKVSILNSVPEKLKLDGRFYSCDRLDGAGRPIRELDSGRTLRREGTDGEVSHRI